MQWQDHGLILSLRSHGEGHAVAELLTRDHGRHLGLVRGGLSRKQRPLLQPGNTVAASWSARLEQHLGTYSLELMTERAGGWLHEAAPLHALATLSAHLHHLAEREQHPGLYEASTQLLDNLNGSDDAKALFILFELRLLQEFGFGLDLDHCAVTGVSDNLTAVSPKTGRAVCADEAAPFIDKLLPLPAFLASRDHDALLNAQEIRKGAFLTGYFLERHLYAPRGEALPDARTRFFLNSTGF